MTHDNMIDEAEGEVSAMKFTDEAIKTVLEDNQPTPYDVMVLIAKACRMIDGKEGGRKFVDAIEAGEEATNNSRNDE